MLTKVAKVDGRYYWRLGVPGYPSQALYRLQVNEVNRMFPGQYPIGLRTLFIAITKKCPLQCEHCFEWDNLNKDDTLTTENIIEIVHRYQDYGTTQIMLSGGEPMLRINDIYRVLEAAKPGTDFWIITSGLGLNAERARKLKDTGLTGVMVSLDHFLPDQHNTFRGFDGAWDHAITAVIAANKVGLVTTLAICTTKAFITKKNLAAYMELSRKLGVSFVQFIEPRATGRYRGRAVTLEQEHLDLLEATFLRYNSAPEYRDYPIINYLGYHQRRIGCFGGGDRFFYVDTDGDAHLCPFCAGKVNNVLQFPADETIQLLSQHHCHDYSGGEGF